MTFESGLKTGQQYDFFEVIAKALKSRGLGFASGVPGGGCAQFEYYLEKEGIPYHTSSTEPASVAEAIGYQSLLLELERSLALTFSTHGIGASHGQADIGTYDSLQGRIPLITFIGGNTDGNNTPADFQWMDEERYRPMYGKNIFKVNTEYGIKPEDITQLLDMVDDAYREGKPVLISLPNNFTFKKVEITEKLLKQINNPAVLEPERLSSKAKRQLDKLHEQINLPDTRVLFMPGEGVKHAIRLFGRKVYDLMNNVMDKIVGNRIMSADNTDLMAFTSGHEFVTASHNHDPNLQKAVESCNLTICCGTGPTATITGISADSLLHYQNKPIVIIDPSQEILDLWKKALPGNNATFIKADLPSALKYLNEKEYLYTQERAHAAETTAGNLWDEVFDGKELNNVQQLRDLHMAIAEKVGEGKNVGIIADSGDSGNTFLRYAEAHNGPGTVFYPLQGRLGEVTGAAYSWLQHGNFEQIVLFTGDGGMGYSVGELKDLAQLAQEKNIPVTVVVLNNQSHKSVGKGEKNFTLDTQQHKDIREGIRRTTLLKKSLYHKAVEMFPHYNPKGVAVLGDNPASVADTISTAMKRPGLTIVEVDTTMIEKAPSQQGSNPTPPAFVLEAREALRAKTARDRLMASNYPSDQGRS